MTRGIAGRVLSELWVLLEKADMKVSAFSLLFCPHFWIFMVIMAQGVTFRFSGAVDASQ